MIWALRGAESSLCWHPCPAVTPYRTPGDAVGPYTEATARQQETTAPFARMVAFQRPSIHKQTATTSKAAPNGNLSATHRVDAGRAESSLEVCQRNVVVPLLETALYQRVVDLRPAPAEHCTARRRRSARRTDTACEQPLASSASDGRCHSATLPPAPPHPAAPDGCRPPHDHAPCAPLRPPRRPLPAHPLAPPNGLAPGAPGACRRGCPAHCMASPAGWSTGTGGT